MSPTRKKASMPASTTAIALISDSSSAAIAITIEAHQAPSSLSASPRETTTRARPSRLARKCAPSTIGKGSSPSRNARFSSGVGVTLERTSMIASTMPSVAKSSGVMRPPMRRTLEATG